MEESTSSMPVEREGSRTKSVAIVGGGISGMGAAFLLSQDYQVTLFEAEPSLGGHARTVIAGKRGDQPVDIRFNVFNFSIYPLLRALFEQLGVPVCKSNMSFGVSINSIKLEYSLQSLDALLAQRQNLVRPKFLQMVFDIKRFNRRALDIVEVRPAETIETLLRLLKTGSWFRDYYLLPLSGAIWSTPKHRILDFPARTLVQFFKNHALLNYTGQHQWYTIEGGSIEYVSRLGSALRGRGVDLRTNAKVLGVKREASAVHIKCTGAAWEAFDEVILATHSDDSLRMLSDPRPDEKAALASIVYQPNQVILHADDRVMPRRRKTWSSWVYSEPLSAAPPGIAMTYWMNSLQPIPIDDPHFVTLNPSHSIREDLIYEQTIFRHPVYDQGTIAAQAQLRRINGKNHTWFCGAWMLNGFHEDGLSSATAVANALLSA